MMIYFQYKVINIADRNNNNCWVEYKKSDGEIYCIIKLRSSHL